MQRRCLPEDQNCPVSENEIDKSDQLVCIQYKYPNARLKDTVTSKKNSRVTQN